MENVVPKQEEQEEEEVEVMTPMPLAQVPPKGSVNTRYFDGPRFGLPVQWMIEHRPRTSPKYFGKIDQFFYEPGSGKQFRSLKSVEAHLKKKNLPPPNVTEIKRILKEHKQEARTMTAGTSSLPKASASSHPKPHQASGSGCSERRKQRALSFDFGNPPESVTWTLTDADNDTWSASIGEVEVPAEVKGYWTEIFTSVNNAKGYDASAQAPGA